MKIALIGCGKISAVIAQAIKDRKVDVELKCVYGRNTAKAREFAERFQTVYRDFDGLLKADLDLLVEAASQEVVRTLIPEALKAKINVMILSTGALVDEILFQEIQDLARKNKLKVYLPSGAIVGLDGISAANIEKIKKVTLVIKHPLKSMKGAQFLDKGAIDLTKISRPTIIYEGPAKVAAKLFPTRVNIASSLSIAGIGPEKTNVKIIVDPNIECYIHEILVECSFGLIETRAETSGTIVTGSGIPIRSGLAALSAIATLKKITEPISVGT